MQGLILMAHGARDARWAEPFERTAQRVRELRPGVCVALAYLEFMPPNLHDCGVALAAQGCSEVNVLPLFLGAGGHVRKDLPQGIEALRLAFPTVRWSLHPAVGESALMVETMARIAASLPADIATAAR